MEKMQRVKEVREGKKEGKDERVRERGQREMSLHAACEEQFEVKD